ncbi:MAG: prepilin-type N-terminal cleavage/methylation domain-containing protein [Alphaproteobacteria bacterium]|nr:prepilin-type N-terminal cleavage/methylation domain-containing protein [Alphaproteobacteria bacterium]
MKNKTGFTLLEISIVLVIVGLVFGGVLVGRELIKASEIRATAKQVEQFDTAFNTFKLKYGCISGDCKNAEQFGFKSPTSPSPAMVTNDPWNGNNDGMINNNGSFDEYYTAFWWLQNAGLIGNVKDNAFSSIYRYVPSVIKGGQKGYPAEWAVMWMNAAAVSPGNQFFSDSNSGDGHYYWLVSEIMDGSATAAITAS